MSKTTEVNAERESARAILKRWITRDACIYFVRVGDVGRKTWDFFRIAEDGTPLRLSGYLSRAYGWYYSKQRQCLRVEDPNMVVYEMAWALFGDMKALRPQRLS